MDDIETLHQQVALLQKSRQRLQRGVVACGSLLAVVLLLGAAVVTTHNGDHVFTGLLRSRAIQVDSDAVLSGDVTAKKNVSIDGTLTVPAVKGDMRLEGNAVFLKDVSIEGTVVSPALAKVIPQYEYLGRVGIRTGPVPPEHAGRFEATPGRGSRHLIKKFPGKRVLGAWHSVSDHVHDIPTTFTHIITEVENGNEVWLWMISVGSPKTTIGNVQIHVLYCDE